MRRENIYLSTIADDASEIARKYGLGIEIAEYCTAWNMDDDFTATDASVQVKLEGIERKVCVISMRIKIRIFTDKNVFPKRKRALCVCSSVNAVAYQPSQKSYFSSGKYSSLAMVYICRNTDKKL